ncbi:hypothetical protein MG290_09890 [Flavobacterium sp. CBA20B-1]|uniref:hypothetical protein n=1 Tax=unclassified Flavobacterium TaxID=196869 RepID=UPI002225907E|nr:MULTISPECIES: hypothetical protein [unclassified Flavobacterium]WCM41268.1 hypothetical protein MG290_09890 [Flavobacterium sp. CBA20B-1]
MDTTQAYKEEVKRVSKVFDIAIDSYTKHRPQNWSEEDFDQFISDLKKDKLRIKTMAKKYDSLADLNKYTIPPLFAYFKTYDDETSRYFWQKIKEEQLPCKL